MLTKSHVWGTSASILALVAAGACSKSGSGGSPGGGAGAGGATSATTSTGGGGGATAGSTGGSTTATSSSTTTTTTTTSTSSGTASGCPIFTATSPWNEDISAALTTTQYALPSVNLHPDFDNLAQDGIPYQYVTAAVAKSHVVFDGAPTESDTGPYPIPANPLIEGQGSGDAHMLMVETDTCVLYELFQVSKQGSTWHAYSGAIWDLKTNAARPRCWTSADAAGLPIYPGLVRYEEVASGVITHAIRFTLNTVQTAFTAPANHLAGSDTSAKDPPFGLRVRLKASVDISAAPPQAKVILTAMKKYGLILADSGSDWYIGGASSPSWDFDKDVSTLESYTGGQFEVVKPGAITTPTSNPSCSP